MELYFYTFKKPKGKFFKFYIISKSSANSLRFMAVESDREMLERLRRMNAMELEEYGLVLRYNESCTVIISSELLKVMKENEFILLALGLRIRRGRIICDTIHHIAPERIEKWKVYKSDELYSLIQSILQLHVFKLPTFPSFINGCRIWEMA